MLLMLSRQKGGASLVCYTEAHFPIPPDGEIKLVE